MASSSTPSPDLLDATQPSTAHDASQKSKTTMADVGLSMMKAWDRILLFASIFLVAFAYSLDGCMRPVTFQPAATSAMGQHALIGSINIVVSVTAAAFQPVIAKIADVFGRLEVVVLSVIFYGIGTLIQALARDVAMFASGAVVYNLGYIAIVLLVEVVIADMTSLRARVFFSYIPTLPFLVNTWLSGDVADASLQSLRWRWSIGIWGFVYAGCTLPLMGSLWIYYRRAKKNGNPKHDNPARQEFKQMRWMDFLIQVFWQLDIPGMVLLAAALGLTLTPLTIARGVDTKWTDAVILVPLVFGIVLFPVFAFWETRTLHPMMPYHLLRDRAVWASLAIALTFNTAFSVQNEYAFVVFRLGFHQTTKEATRIANLYSFTSVIPGAITGYLVFRIRYLRPFIIAGTILYTAGFILLAIFNGDETPRPLFYHDATPIMWSQVLLGVGGGLFPYLTMASVQAAVAPEHLAVITGLYLSTYRIGAALGGCIAGTVLNQIGLPAFYSTLTDQIAGYVYESPLSFANEVICENPWIVDHDECAYTIADYFLTAAVYKSIQRYLCIVAACLCVPLMLFAFCIRNPKLGDDSSMGSQSEVVRTYESYEMTVSEEKVATWDEGERESPASYRTAVRSAAPSPSTNASPRKMSAGDGVEDEKGVEEIQLAPYTPTRGPRTPRPDLARSVPSGKLSFFPKV